MTKGRSVLTRRRGVGWLLIAAMAPVCALTLAGCDKLLTSAPPEGETLDGTLDGLSPSLSASFARGDEFFDRNFTVRDGLGPIFNEPNCASCHPGDGRGPPSTAVTIFNVTGFVEGRSGGGGLQVRSIPGVEPETLPPGAEISIRLPPPVFGLGLIMAISVETLLSLADPDDADGDGISGRVSMVQAADFVPARMVGGGPGLQVGRLGRKASFSSLLGIVPLAYQQDMGITSDFFPDENVPFQSDVIVGDQVPDPEISADQVLDVVMYLRLLAPPSRGEITEEVRRGDQMFSEIGCVSCHVPTLKTGPSPIPQLNEVDVSLYSDVLLHDMGLELADNIPEGTAMGFEWRTTPLWGLRLAADALGGTAFFLHDGRTSDLSEAIQFHGGEAEAARNRVVALSESDREALIAFLMSL